MLPAVGVNVYKGPAVRPPALSRPRVVAGVGMVHGPTLSGHNGLDVRRGALRLARVMKAHVGNGNVRLKVVGEA